MVVSETSTGEVSHYRGRARQDGTTTLCRRGNIQYTEIKFTFTTDSLPPCLSTSPLFCPPSPLGQWDTDSRVMDDLPMSEVETTVVGRTTSTNLLRTSHQQSLFSRTTFLSIKDRYYKDKFLRSICVVTFQSLLRSPRRCTGGRLGLRGTYNFCRSSDC